MRLRIYHMSQFPNTAAFPNITDICDRHIFSIIELVLTALEEDTVALVEKGVLAKVREYKDLGETLHDDPCGTPEHLRRVERALKEWKSTPHPLSTKKSQLLHLILLSSFGHPLSTSGPRNSDANGSSDAQIARRLWTMGTNPPNHNRWEAPVWSQGNVRHILPIAVLMVRQAVPKLADSASMEFWAQRFSKMLVHKSIRFLPAPLPTAGTAGRRPTAPSWNDWYGLGREDQNHDRPKVKAVKTIDDELEAAAKAATQNDRKAPWTATRGSLSSMGAFWLRDNLPDDFILNPKGPVAEADQHRYIQNNYDVHNIRHHLALTQAILLTFLAPNHYLPRGTQFPLALYKQSNRANYYRAISKVIGGKKEGGQSGGIQKRPIFVMWMYVLFSILDPSSPWGKIIKKKKSPYSIWGDKAGM